MRKYARIDDWEIEMVRVRFDDGKECWVSAAEYRANPPRGSFVISDNRKPAPTNSLESPK